MCPKNIFRPRNELQARTLLAILLKNKNKNSSYIAVDNEVKKNSISKGVKKTLRDDYNLRFQVRLRKNNETKKKKNLPGLHKQVKITMIQKFPSPLKMDLELVPIKLFCVGFNEKD